MSVKSKSRRLKGPFNIDIYEEIPEILWPSIQGKSPSEIKKLTKLRSLYTDLPRTQKQIELSRKKDWMNLVFHTDIREWSGATICLFNPFCVPALLVDSLEESTKVLCATFVLKPKKGTRGLECTYHLGNWCRCRKIPGLTSQTKHPAAVRWLEANKLLFQFISDIFRDYNEPLWSRYLQVITKNSLTNFLCVWATCALNINFPCQPHFDSLDRLGGLCWVLAFGKFIHGELVFPFMKICIPMGSGCLVAFNSTEIAHYVRNYEGFRNSIVLFTHDEMFSK